MVSFTIKQNILQDGEFPVEEVEKIKGIKITEVATGMFDREITITLNVAFETLEEALIASYAIGLLVQSVKGFKELTTSGEMMGIDWDKEMGDDDED